MPLDPQAQKVLDATAALGLPPTEQMTPAEARESMRSRTAALGPVEDVARVDDHQVPVDGGTITVRCYTPAGRGPFPAYVYFHGGGWVIGDIETHDGICRSLANASGSVVASVDYRLAPEHKYPVAAKTRTRRPSGSPARPRVSASTGGAWLSAVTARAATSPPPSAS